MNNEGEKVKVEDLACEFSVLSNPTRLRLLMKIHDGGPCTLKELVDDVQRDESTVKRHLKELVDHGFVIRSNDKRPKYYITDKGVLAISFLKVKVEPTVVHNPMKNEELKVKVRGEGPLSTFSYTLRKAGFKKIFLYSLSMGCILLGLLGLIISSVELLYRILWLLLWLIAAYIFKVLAS